jgi:hypothetical protein
MLLHAFDQAELDLRLFFLQSIQTAGQFVNLFGKVFRIFNLLVINDLQVFVGITFVVLGQFLE